jgi:uncharacterized damage-inducible protein DinB
MSLTADDVRGLFEYDRWATRQVLGLLDGIDESLWGATGIVGERGLGSILVHMLGAHQRWRTGISAEGEEDGPTPRPEKEPLPDPTTLVAWWEAEFVEMDGFLAGLTDGGLAYIHEGIAVWQMLAHLVNHGTQHRSEAALLLTQAGRSPGELDLIVYLEDVVPSLGQPAAPGTGV